MTLPLIARPYRLCLMHSLDPRGAKLGGVETHVRQILSRHPDDFSVLFVGLDEIGDLTPGKVVDLDYQGRAIEFLPVAHVPGERINSASKTVLGSTTLRFFVGMIRHALAIHRAIGEGPWSADVQRYEFALPPKLLGGLMAMTVHNEGGKEDKMDSLLSRYWFLHEFNEKLSLRLADHIFGVNPNIVARIDALFPQWAGKAEVMSVAIDTDRFKPAPFDCADGVLRVCFAGQLDAFKDPPLMFAMLAKLAAKLNGALEFHYVGATDPHRYAEFAAIEAITTRHGPKTADEVAQIMRRCHAGVLTSHFEGMPCYLLEMLASGRPVGAIALPQYAPLILPGVSGALVERSDPPTAAIENLSDAFVDLWASIRAGGLDPQKIAALTQPYSIKAQMTRLFDVHRALQRGEKPERSNSPAI